MELLAIIVIAAVYGLIAIFFVSMTIVGIVRRVREKPSEFCAGVARSIVEDAATWNYDLSEGWIISHKAHLEISLSHGRVNTRQPINSGTNKLADFRGADWRAFRRALARWRELTAIEREQLAARRRREALAELARAS